MKIFISYSKRDASDFADQIKSHFVSFKRYDIFTDLNSIKVGEVWTNNVEDNISNCDVFVAIVTYGALQSPHVENEVLQAQRENKRIIPCFHESVISNDIKWGLDKFQGIKFSDKYELARDLYANISQSASYQREITYSDKILGNLPSQEQHTAKHGIFQKLTDYLRHQKKSRHKVDGTPVEDGTTNRSYESLNKSVAGTTVPKYEYPSSTTTGSAPDKAVVQEEEEEELGEAPAGAAPEEGGTSEEAAPAEAETETEEEEAAEAPAPEAEEGETYAAGTDPDEDTEEEEEEEEEAPEAEAATADEEKDGDIEEKKPIAARPATNAASEPQMYSGTDEQTDEQTLERYPYSRFPSKIALGSIVPLDIIIKTASSYPQAPTTLKIRSSKKDQSDVPISVIVDVDPRTFEMQGENYYATIYVPVESKDSIPVTFFLKAKKEGQQNINIRFFQQGTFLGKLTVNTLVVASSEEISEVPSQAISADWRLPRRIHPGPDITLYIMEMKYADNEVKYDVLLSSAEFPLKGLGPIIFKGNPQIKFQSMFEDIENRNLPANVIENRIKAKGRTLYDEIFPKDLKDLYWDKRDKIETIRVISQEPWIPWEIVKPYRKTNDGKLEEDAFLCERYSFSRWIKDVPEVKPESNGQLEKQLKKAILVAPSDTNLEFANHERDWLEKYAKESRLDIDVISSYEEVIRELDKGGFDLLHFMSHGVSNDENSLYSALQLANGGEIRPDEIFGNFGDSNPLVFLNACQTGIQGISFTKIVGWSEKFIGAGCSAFIGTLWSVSDTTAAKFTEEFYTQLKNGIPIGEAVRRSRLTCKTSGDPSWLAYQLYAHPNLQATLSE